MAAYGNYDLNKVERENADSYADMCERLYISTLFWVGIYRQDIEMFKRYIPKPGSRVLDWGCGTGYTLARIAEDGFTNLYGLDISKKMIEQAGAKNKNLKLVMGDGKRPGFADGSFEVIYCQHTLHHLPGLTGVMAEFERCLVPGGHLVITEPDVDIFQRFPPLGYPFRAVRKLLTSMGVEEYDEPTEDVEQTPHHRYLTKDEIISAIKEAGLEVVLVRSRSFISYAFHSIKNERVMDAAFRIDDLLSAFMPSGGFVIDVVGRKANKDERQ